MYWDVVEVKVQAKFILSVRFSDGLTGKVQFLPTHFTGVFTSLKSETFFNQVFIQHGAVTWPGEIDLAPDAMYDAIKKDGVWLLK